jgi:hypothetical protein
MVSFCRDKERELIAGRGKITDRWVEYFSDFLNKDTADEEGEENLEAENDICLPPPTLEEVKEQIKTIKNNRAPGVDNITGEMIKHGGDELLKHSVCPH